ncbi:hypothetical protein F5Y14DRAFT_238255 [Nemania sp. NC0429]|nr:hypothetical protein F5Y14DRAFT_238255 [Nemania sp. NC0429]
MSIRQQSVLLLTLLNVMCAELDISVVVRLFVESFSISLYSIIPMDSTLFSCLLGLRRVGQYPGYWVKLGLLLCHFPGSVSCRLYPIYSITQHSHRMPVPVFANAVHYDDCPTSCK